MPGAGVAPERPETVRRVRSPLSEAMLGPLGPESRWVSLRGLLADAEYERVAEVMRPRPDVGLSISWTRHQGIRDLEFLRFFPWLERLYVFATSVEDLTGLAHVSGLRDLIIGTCRRSRSLRSLAGLAPTLRCLKVEGPVSAVGALSELTGLRTLTLRSVSMPDLSALAPMTELRGLDLKLGNTRDLSLLPAFTKLQYFEAWMIRGLADLSMLAEVTCLEELFLQQLTHLTDLPSLHKLTRLRRITLETMDGLSDVSFLMTAPALEELRLSGRNLDPASVNQLAAHPTLRRGWILMRTNALQSQLILNLPPIGSPSLYLALQDAALSSTDQGQRADLVHSYRDPVQQNPGHTRMAFSRPKTWPNSGYSHRAARPDRYVFARPDGRPAAECLPGPLALSASRTRVAA